MKAISVLLVLGSAAFVSAQSQCSSVAAAIPSCGQSCLASAEASVGCAPGDFACPCSSSQAAAIQSGALECVINACGAVTGLAVSSSALAVCSCVATAASAPASSTPASSSASASGSPSNTGSASGSGSSSAKASITGSPTSGGSGNSTNTGSSSLSVFTGGAARVIGAGGAVVGGFIGLMAAL